MDNESLGQNEGTGRSDQRTEDIELSIVFPQKYESKGRRKKEAKDPDGDGGHRVNHEQGIQALTGREVMLKVSHGNGKMRRYTVVVILRYDFLDVENTILCCRRNE